MTSTEKAERRPVAKEIAEQAMAVATEAQSTAATAIAELRDLRESAAASGGSATADTKIVERIDKLDEDIEGLLDNLNKVAAMVQNPGSGEAADLEPLRKEIKTGFDAYNEALTAHGRSLQHVKEDTEKAIATLSGRLDVAQTHGDPAANTSLQRLRAEVDELAGWVKTFDEAGVAPASREDVDSLHNRLIEVEKYLSSDGPSLPPLPQAPAGVPAVHGQVWRLMQRVTELGKDSQADKSMGGYKFRSIDAAMSAVGHALREIGLMFIPGEILDKRVERYTTQGHEWRNGTRYEKTLNWTHVWVTQRYRFQSLIDGSLSEPFEMDGEARDNGDKSTSKADSMRMKYALLQALCIPTEGLPESDGRDGTEGADWGSAPPVGHGSGGQQQAYSDEPTWEPGDAQHARSAVEANEQQAPAQAAPDNRPDSEKAASAVKALRDLSSLPPGERRQRFQRIADAVGKSQLGSIVVEGSTVTQHLIATNANLGAS